MADRIEDQIKTLTRNTTRVRIRSMRNKMRDESMLKNKPIYRGCSAEPPVLHQANRCMGFLFSGGSCGKSIIRFKEVGRSLFN